ADPLRSPRTGLRAGAGASMAKPDEFDDKSPEEFDLGSAADAAFDAAGDEAPENDEVLVFQMEDDEDPYPKVGAPDVDGGDSALPPDGDVDEFSELGDRWDARANGEEYVPSVAAPNRTKAILAAVGACAVVVTLSLAFRGEKAGEDAEVAKVDSGA